MKKETHNYLFAAESATQASAPPDHRVQLPGGQWALWRCVGLRSAGFPVAQVLELSDPRCATAADQLLQIKDQRQKAHADALKAINKALDDLRAAGEWDNKSKRAPLLKTMRQLKKKKVPPFNEGSATVELDAYRRANAAVDPAKANFEQAIAKAITSASRTIEEIAHDKRFREAIVWQNRQALQTGIKPLLRRIARGDSRNSQQRQHEELIVNYLQRYCTKNETIGFFGPVGWAKFVPQGKAIVARPGPDLLAKRTVYFEEWGINALAQLLAQNTALRPWFVPRRSPFVHLQNTTLHLPSKPSIQLPAAQAALLQACDGRHTAREVALTLIQHPDVPLKSEVAIYRLLENLEDMGLIIWSLEVPLTAYPERLLRQKLERIEDERLRRSALSTLDRLEKARDTVAQAAGNSKRLMQTLHNLETTFRHLTGKASTRAAGQMYAARTLVYEDCQRDIDVKIGPQILKSLVPPLTLLLTSARWFTFEAATIYRQIARDVYTGLAQQLGSTTIDAVTFWQKFQHILLANRLPTDDTLVPLFQKRWADILCIPPDTRRVQYTSTELQPKVQAAFDAPRPGWQVAHYHSPDILIAAASLNAIQQGQYQLVMGEVHLGGNTLGASLFVQQHPSIPDLIRAQEYDLPGTNIRLTTPRYWPRLTSRTHPSLSSVRDFYLIHDEGTHDVPPSRALPIGALVIEDTGKELVAKTRDGQLQFDMINLIGDLLSFQMINNFRIFTPRSYTPRVTIDRLVIARESWRFAAADMEFAYANNEADTFLAARRWLHAHGIPRFVFVKSPVEVKPFYVDFDSPISINIFAKVVRRTHDNLSSDTTIAITEMLPDPTQAWLPDAEGQLYTSEFRIVAVDLTTSG